MCNAQSRHRSNRPLATSLALLVGGALSAQAQTPEFTVTDLGVAGSNPTAWSTNSRGDAVGWTIFNTQFPQGFVALGSQVTLTGTILGTSASYVISINDQRVACGNNGLAFENNRAATWRAGVGWQNIGTLGGSRANALCINNRGQVVGWSSDATGRVRPYVWQNGVMTPLQEFGGAFNAARWINDNGLIVGESAPAVGGGLGVYWQGGSIAQLSPFVGAGHVPLYVHNNGNIAGWAIFEDINFDSRAVLWRDGEIIKRLGTLADGTPTEPFALSAASCVNIHGTIIGTSTVPGPPEGTRAFIYRRGVMRDLSTLVPAGWQIINVGPGSLNDAGQIIAVGVFNNQGRAVRLTPIVAPCLGDIDDNRTVNLLDMFRLFDDLGCQDGFEACPSDIDNTGATDVADYAIMQRRIGSTCS